MRHDSHPMLPLTLAASAALVGSASAATDVTTALSVAIKEGDPVVGIGNLTTIDTLSVNDAGTWLVECDTDNANTNIDQAVVINAAVIAREGDAIAPAGATIGSFGSGGTRLNTAGDYAFNYFLDGLTTTTDSGIYLNTTLVIQEGSVSTAPHFSA
jgi:hypothetical protein